MTMIEIVYFLDFIDNIDHLKNLVDRIPFYMISKCIKLYIRVLHGLQSNIVHLFFYILKSILKSYKRVSGHRDFRRGRYSRQLYKMNGSDHYREPVKDPQIAPKLNRNWKEEN